MLPRRCSGTRGWEGTRVSVAWTAEGPRSKRGFGGWEKQEDPEFLGLGEAGLSALPTSAPRSGREQPSLLPRQGPCPQSLSSKGAGPTGSVVLCQTRHSMPSFQEPCFRGGH